MEEKPVAPVEEPVAPVEESSEPQTVSVTIPTGTASPGCETSNECYLPASVTINVGDTVEWENVDTAAHTVTGGSPADGPSGVFDSSLIMGGASFEHTFDAAGSYDYFCMVHPWMVGNVKVN
jgi:plastocyanin